MASKKLQVIGLKVPDVDVGNQAVLYNQSQTLSDIQKAQARTNIGAPSKSELVNGLVLLDDRLYLTIDGELASDGIRIPVGEYVPGEAITLTNLLESNAIITASGASAYIRFKYASSEDTRDGTLYLYINEVLRQTKTIIQGENEIDIGQLLSEGVNTIEIICKDAYGNQGSLSYSAEVVSLKLTATFDDSVTHNGEFLFKYTPFGAVNKTVYFEIDNELIDTQTVSTNGKQVTMTLPAQSHGVHSLRVYAIATINGVDIRSNVLTYEVMCVEEGKTAKMIASSCTVNSVTEGEMVSISYTVYDPSSITSAISLVVRKGDVVHSTVDLIVDRTRHVWSTRDYPVGEVTFEIICDDVRKSHTLNVIESSFSVDVVTNDLELNLQSSGRSNNEPNPSVWKYDSVSTTFSDVNWVTTGWVPDEEGDSVLRLFGDARAEIGFAPFATDLRGYGKTIELDFAIRDVNNRDAVVISCMSDGIGFEATADKATIYSEQSSIDCRYRDEDRIRIAFTVEASSEYRMLSVYLNGVLSGVKQYPTTDNFQQSVPVDIRIGSNDCAVDFYGIRSYSTALTQDDIKNNYMASITNLVEKAAVLNDNDIYDNFGAISYEAVVNKIPVMVITGDLPKSKGDKKDVTVEFTDPVNHNLNFYDTAVIDVQGTSSQYYIRKNWKIKTANYHQHAPNQMEARVFCMKADYAEATGTHNTQNANFAHTLYDTKTPPQETNDLVRTTIYGFPCVIFHKANASSTPEFIGKYNYNFDKSAENVFGFSSEYPDVESVEFCNNTSDFCLFHEKMPDTYLTDPSEWKNLWPEAYQTAVKNGDTFFPWTDDFEHRYPEELKDISAFKKMHDWVVSTYQAAATGEALNEAYTGVDGVVHTNDTAAYRLAKFKKEFTEYFDMDFSLVYYVYTFVMLMVDQRAKNMFLTTWDGIHWAPWLSDNDTCAGINNEGVMVFDYYHEDIDTVDGANVYNGQNSTLWVNFRQSFATEIQDTYRALRSDKRLSYDNIIEHFIYNGSDKWSISIYNEDADYKYISMLRNNNDASNLYQVRGTGEEHLKYFVDNRLKYCDSKWYAADYADNIVSLRIYTPVDANGVPLEGLVVEPNADITITPYSNMYAGVRYKANGTLQQWRVDKNEPYTFEAPDETFNDTETAIYGASEISSLGDLAPLYCGTVKIEKATKLTELKVGDATEGYQNLNMKTLSIGTNRLLQKLDIRNCPNLTDPLVVSGCPSIEEIYATGSGITGVELPDGGYLKVLHLPGTITNLTMRNQVSLEDFTMEGYSNVSTLWVDNSPAIPTYDIVTTSTKLSRVRLIGIKWNLEDKSLLDRLASMAGLDEKGNNTIVSVLTGHVHVPTMTAADFIRYRNLWPELMVTCDVVVSQWTISYIDDDGTDREEVYRVEYILAGSEDGNGNISVETDDATITDDGGGNITIGE